MRKPITGTDWQGDYCELVDLDGEQVYLGDVVTDFRGTQEPIAGGFPPHKIESQGKVWTDNFGPQYYPSVFNLKWVKR